MATVFLAACGASGADNNAPGGSFSSDIMLSAIPDALPGLPGYTSEADMSYGDAEQHPLRAQSGGGSLGGAAEPIDTPANDFAEKIIYSAWAEIETLEFDKTIDRLEALIALHGAIIENSNVRGNNYASTHYGGQSFRYANYTIRVPVIAFDTVRAQLDGLGNVVSQSSNAMNITSQFTDTEARRKSLLIQEERLLDMLSKAEDIPDLIMIEERISNVRYQIELLTTTLNNWQRQVDYSSLSVNISEVEEYTEFVPIHRSYWEQMGDGLMSTLRGIGRFFTTIFMWTIVSAPVIIIMVIVALIALVIIKAKLRAYKKKKSERPAPVYPAPYAAPPQTPTDTQE